MANRRVQKPVGGEQICIYCKALKNLRDFNTDHVIPISFGAFRGALTLVQTVCRECNDFFSKELELFLARDSLWGLLRFRYGLRAFGANRWKHNSRVRLVLDDQRLGEWNGAIVELIPPRDASDTDPEIILLPQVSFFKKGDNIWKNLSIDQIHSREDLISENFDLTRCKLIGNTESDIKEAMAKLLSLGIDTSTQEDMSRDTVNPVELRRLRVNVSSKIDAIILRSVAKIAFNYLAKMQGTGFVIRQEFDDIREFIRNGEHIDRGLATAEATALQIGNMRPNAHIIIVRWADQGFRRIIAHVSLFNYITFNVVLCSSFSGIIRPLDCGHIYYLANKEVLVLRPSRIVRS